MTLEVYKHDSIYRTLLKARKSAGVTRNASDVMCNLATEFGQFSEAVQVERGIVTRDDALELNASISEGADMIICILDVLAKTHPNRSPSEICTLLHREITVRSDKTLNVGELLAVG